MATSAAAENVPPERHFFLDSVAAPGNELTVVSAGREVCAPGHRVQTGCAGVGASCRRMIEFVSSGAGEVTVDGQTTPLAPGAYFASEHSIRQQLVIHARAPLIKYFVAFAGDAQRVSFDGHLPQPGTVLRTSALADITESFDELIRTGMRRGQHVSRMLSIQLERLVLRLAETALPLDSRVSPALLTFHRCRQYIQEHWADLSNVEQLARECGVAPSYVCRLFKRFGGKSPYQYLLHQKMTRAADLLTKQATCVKDVAHELGFSDPFHFSRVFKKTMGVSPSALRASRVKALRPQSGRLTPDPLAPG